MQKVLVVDDSKSQQLLVSGLLKAIGLEVIRVEDGKTALNKLKEGENINLIIMDIVLPNKISGLDICRQIRNDQEYQQYKKVPIVFCSQKDQKFDIFWALRQGGNDYLTKPYSPTDLINIVRKYLDEAVTGENS